MALTTHKLNRIFCIGAMQLPDPVPNGTLDDAVRALSQQYPQFRQSRLFEEDGQPDIARGEVVFKLQLPAPKKNG